MINAVCASCRYVSGPNNLVVPARMRGNTEVEEADTQCAAVRIQELEMIVPPQINILEMNNVL